ncbi:MAG: hypothetical protein DUD31_06920 [Coriobacteriaceae bacterium]|jgi:hypothetical protein|uniref:Ig-like domain-containing protein n=1 Tax=Tractidigestivibacter scatoligenes TaxID=1299998 RepID=A0A117J4S0_TRASO|nr:hypothetical protein [Tractidigestivibacter scatoligenes]KUH59324.1 hypothetical protein AUL39_03115 [Tractidigestivibacter scatoligenes]MCH4083854.1 hypothetical protein [Olsenella sp.]RRF92986.1 MAG: hypothetical protein DUD31_06920 [Coriobacteriaceae bacterium]
MERRKRAVAIAAAGAVAVLVAATLARCSAARSASATDAGTSGATAAQTTTDTAGSDAGGSAGETGEAGSCASALESREWMGADDASERLTASGGRIVETDGTNTYTSSYRVTEDSAGSCELSITRADGTVVQATATITGDGDDARLRCEQLQVAFDWVPAPTDGEVRVTGVDDEYLSLVGGDETALDAAVRLWVSMHVPGASEAAFDGEVFLDTNEDRVTATFTCDDPGRTVVSVEWSGGAFSVTG